MSTEQDILDALNTTQSCLWKYKIGDDWHIVLSELSGMNITNVEIAGPTWSYKLYATTLSKGEAASMFACIGVAHGNPVQILPIEYLEVIRQILGEAE